MRHLAALMACGAMVWMALWVVNHAELQAQGEGKTLNSQDLKALARSFLGRIEETLSSPEEFQSESAQDVRYQHAHALALVAVAWGRMSQDQSTGAAALWKAALGLADTEKLSEAKQLLQQAQAALEGQASSEKLPAWGPEVAELDGLMQVVSSQQNRINRSLRRLRRRASRVGQGAAFMVAVGRLLQHRVPDSSEAEPEQQKAWRESSLEMEQAAWALLQAAADKDSSAAKAANRRLDRACHRCHEAMGIDE